MFHTCILSLIVYLLTVKHFIELSRRSTLDEVGDNPDLGIRHKIHTHYSTLSSTATASESLYEAHHSAVSTGVIYTTDCVQCTYLLNKERKQYRVVALKHKTLLPHTHTHSKSYCWSTSNFKPKATLLKFHNPILQFALWLWACRVHVLLLSCSQLITST